MAKTTFAIFLSVLLIACIPDKMKEKMAEGMRKGKHMLGDQEFKKAIGHIELHKLRNGSYPESLSALKFLTAMDSSVFDFVEYTRLDSVYELNLKMKFPFGTNASKEDTLYRYPAEFWHGLGCVKSNLK